MPSLSLGEEKKSPENRSLTGEVITSATEALHSPQCPRAISPSSWARDHRASPQNTCTRMGRRGVNNIGGGAKVGDDGDGEGSCGG